MVFSSLLFLFAFLPAALVLYFGAAGVSRWNRIVCCWTLTALSLSFYFWGSGRFVLLMVASILFNWFVGRRLASMPRGLGRHRLLLAGIAANLATLGYFKYSRFFLDNLGALAGAHLAPHFHPYLPVGVSFFTFMSIAYLVDIERGEQEPASLPNYATYLSLFPHLVAGPIVRYGEIAQDLRTLNRPSLDNFNAGIFRFAQGLGMKVLLADNLSVAADRIFGLDPGTLTFADAWLGALTYTFQIYFDFAGYSAMAIGLALMFGFHFPENFDQPYRARSVTEFWRRWHMTLSRFLRDYLYIPLGGNRKGPVRTYVNLVLVFFICGLWHGAAWTFVAWGLYQGALLIAERLAKSRFGVEPHGIPGVALTFFLTCVGWVIFRADSLPHAWRFLRAMLSMPTDLLAGRVSANVAELADPLLLTVVAGAAVFSFAPRPRWSWPARGEGRLAYAARALASFALLLAGSAYALANSYKPFIYFRF